MDLVLQTPTFLVYRMLRGNLTKKKQDDLMFHIKRRRVKKTQDNYDIVLQLFYIVLPNFNQFQNILSRNMRRVHAIEDDDVHAIIHY